MNKAARKVVKDADKSPSVFDARLALKLAKLQTELEKLARLIHTKMDKIQRELP